MHPGAVLTWHRSPQSWTVTGSKSYPGPSHGAQIGTVTDAPGAACTNTSLDTSVGTWMGVAMSTATFNSWTTGGDEQWPRGLRGHDR